METRPGSVVFLGRSSRHTHHRDAKERGHIQDTPVAWFTTAPIITIWWGLSKRSSFYHHRSRLCSAMPFRQEKSTKQNKQVYTQDQFLWELQHLPPQGIFPPLETFRSHAVRVATHPRGPGFGADQRKDRLLEMGWHNTYVDMQSKWRHWVSPNRDMAIPRLDHFWCWYQIKSKNRQNWWEF